MVPIFSIISSSFIPIPLSEIEIMFSFLRIFTLICGSFVNLASVLFFNDLNLSLSKASDAFETSSLTKISLSEYKE